MVIVAPRWERENWWPDLVALCTRRTQLGPGPKFLRGGTVPMREPDWEVWAFLLDSSGPASMPATPGGTEGTAERYVSLAPAGVSGRLGSQGGSGVILETSALGPGADGPSEPRPFRIEPGLARNPAGPPSADGRGPSQTAVSLCRPLSQRAVVGSPLDFDQRVAAPGTGVGGAVDSDQLLTVPTATLTNAPRLVPPGMVPQDGGGCLCEPIGEPTGSPCLQVSQ